MSEKVLKFSLYAPKPGRNDLHLPRRFFHMVSGVSIAAFSFLMPDKRDYATFLVVITLIDFAFEGFRLLIPRFNAWVVRSFRSIIREGEQDRVSGIAYYLLGCLLSVLLFPRDIALLSILFLAFGDPVASIAGVLIGKRKWPSDVSPQRKTLEGSLACFLFCAFLTLGMSYFLGRCVNYTIQDRIVFAVLGGFSAGLGELLPLRTDDNFVMPLVAGTSLWVLSAFFNLMPGIYLF